jgi:hypothetical protein
VTARPPWLAARLSGKWGCDLVSSSRQPPVLAFDLGDTLGIECVFKSRYDVLGRTESSWTSAKVTVLDGGDDDASRRALRVLVARGIGHIMLHAVGATYVLEETPTTPWALQAVRYADALLMPRFLFQPLDFNARLPISELARIFDVPLVAALRRQKFLRNGGSDS